MAILQNRFEKRTNYSLSWAAIVFSEFRNQYARATEIVNKKMGFSEEFCIGLVANCPAYWQNYKKLVKYVQKYGVIPAEVLKHHLPGKNLIAASLERLR